MSAKKFLDITAIFLLLLLLVSLGAVLHNFNELEKMEREIILLKAEKSSGIQGKLDDMLERMERENDR